VKVVFARLYASKNFILWNGYGKVIALEDRLRQLRSRDITVGFWQNIAWAKVLVGLTVGCGSFLA